MTVLLPYIVVGLVSGSVYGLAGVGLVLTYKTSGAFNFAYGGIATIAAFTFYGLNVELGWRGDSCGCFGHRRRGRRRSCDGTIARR